MTESLTAKMEQTSWIVLVWEWSAEMVCVWMLMSSATVVQIVQTGRTKLAALQSFALLVFCVIKDCAFRTPPSVTEYSIAWTGATR